MPAGRNFQPRRCRDCVRSFCPSDVAWITKKVGCCVLHRIFLLCYGALMNSRDADEGDLDWVDREIRIERLKREIKRITGSDFINGRAAGCDPSLEEAFVEHVLTLETHGST